MLVQSFKIIKIFKVTSCKFVINLRTKIFTTKLASMNSELGPLFIPIYKKETEKRYEIYNLIESYTILPNRVR